MQRKAAAANLVRKQALEQLAAAARAEVATLVAEPRAPRSQAARARAPTSAQLRAPEEAGGRGSAR